MSTKDPQPDSYHHGNLRETLLQSALTLLAKGSADTLSLRKVAKHAGVSHGAPYRHFKDKEALLAAVAEQGFHTMAALMQQAIATLKDPEDPVAQLRALGQSYLTFAINHPTHFGLMFGPCFQHDDAHQGVHKAGQSCFDMLLGCVRQAIASGSLPPGSPEDMALGYWSLVQGAASLHIHGMLVGVFEEMPDLHSEDLARRAIEQFLRTHRSLAP